MTLTHQLIWLFVLALPVACLSWTVTHEEVFKEPHEYCKRLSERGSSLFVRKFFYLFTCEYCFSHYVTILILVLTGYRLYLTDWRGFLLAVFAMVWIANFYMSIYAFLRVDLRSKRIETELEEKLVKERSISSLTRIRQFLLSVLPGHKTNNRQVQETEGGIKNGRGGTAASKHQT